MIELRQPIQIKKALFPAEAGLSLCVICQKVWYDIKVRLLAL